MRGFREESSKGRKYARGAHFMSESESYIHVVCYAPVMEPERTNGPVGS